MAKHLHKSIFRWALLGAALGIGFLANREAVSQSPAIEAVLELPRTEPKHFIEAILTLVDLEKPELAIPIAEDFANQNLTDEQQIALVKQVGTARLLRVASSMPETAELVNRCLATADRNQNDPEKINQLLADIGFGTEQEQRQAYRAIRHTGITGVEKILDAISVAQNPKAEARLREALVVMEPISVPLLMSATNDTSLAVRTQATYALGRLAELGRLHSDLSAALVVKGALTEPADSSFGGAARWTYNQLIGRPFSERKAKQLIKQTITSLLDGPPPFAADELGQVSWKASRDQTLDRYGVRKISLAFAARLAADQAALSPSDNRLRQEAMLLCLEAGKLAPNSQPRLDEFTSQQVSQSLSQSLDASLPVAAIACCKTLAERRDSSVLYSQGGQTSALATALTSTHAAVRFAALEAIMSLEATEPFAGSSHVVEALLYFAAGNSEKCAVVASPQIAKASNLAGELQQLGYRTFAFNRGSDAVKAVKTLPDVELILLDHDLLRPAVRETLYRLRRTAGGGSKPIAILAPEGELLEAGSLAEEHRAAGSLVIAYSRPVTADGVSKLLDRIGQLKSSGVVELPTRQAQAEQSRKWIAQLLEQGPSFYRLQNRRDALELMLNDPSDLSTNHALARLATPTSQERLANRASLRGLPIEARQSAAKAFQESVVRHGLLLTANQILLQYDRYNASQAADEATQEVLGMLLDVIESSRQ